MFATLLDTYTDKTLTFRNVESITTTAEKYHIHTLEDGKRSVYSFDRFRFEIDEVTIC